MPRARDDEFQLRLPVARDRTLRRIGLFRLTLVFTLIGSVFTLLVLFSLTEESLDGRRTELGKIGDVFFAGALFTFLISLLLFWLTGIYESTVLTRRYGWRAVSDSVEAQRIATREALYDVTSAGTLVVPNGEDMRPSNTPVQRLRCLRMHLKPTIEHNHANTERER